MRSGPSFARYMALACWIAVVVPSTVAASPFLFAQAIPFTGSAYGIRELCNDDESGSAPVAAQGGCGQSFYVFVGDVQVFVDSEASALARAAYGSLGVYAGTYAQMSVNPFGAGQTEARAEALARMDDTIHVLGATSGTLAFDFVVNGSGQAAVLRGNGDGAGMWGVGLINRLTGDVYAPLDWADGTVRIEVPFGPGPTDISFALSAQTMCLVWGEAVCDSEASFFHSATISGVQILDPNGAVIPGATVTAESGFQYPSGSVTTVPEPAALSLLGAGLVALSRTVRRAARNHRLVPAARSDS